MTTPPPTPPPPAHRLVALLARLDKRPFPTGAQIDTALQDFVGELKRLDAKYTTRAPSIDYLRQQVFSRSREFKADSERQVYCRSHLRVALTQLSALITSLQAPTTGRIPRTQLLPWADTIREYVFDLIEIVAFLERRNPAYVFFSGHKSAYVHSWRVFVLSRGLANHSAYTGTGPHFETKTAQIASIAVLRQALELRFERLVGVYLRDPKGKPPRLRHGYHLEYIQANPAHFICSSFHLDELKPIYDWCSEIVHQAYQPYAWQIAWAHEIAGQLMGSRSTPPGTHWNIANAVEVIDPVAMQDAFFQHFLTTYEHGTWRMVRVKPEALVRQWPDPVPVPPSTYQPVRNAQSLWKDLIKLWRRWGPGRRN